ncbi:MAG TPA: tripartite tricarboxylate transporter TctB family protein [Tissierellaceae bacterium]
MRKLDLILSAILIAFSGIVYLMISQLPKEASLYPIFVTTLLLVLSVIQLFKTYRNKEEENEKSPFDGIEKKQMLFVLIASGIYVALINILGYIGSTALYVAAILIGLKTDKKKSVIISIGFCIFIYVLFKILLQVPLPKGLII